jgi:geranylgeranyl pyrophosphate synthase
VCDSVARIVPDAWSREGLGELLLSPRPHYFAAVDPARLAAALNRPIRDITDRAGRGFRSAVAVAVCDAVGGDSTRLQDCLGAIELLQSGALIIDDIEDGSTVRRGGPACHVVHGQALAINAGTLCYFLSGRVIQRSAASAESRLRLHDALWDLCTAAHVGQAMDLQGLDDALVHQAVESGDSGPIEEWLLGVYRLKTAVPIAVVARMAAILGGADERVASAMESFFEAFGVAFQIIDDVLNIRGFEDDRKTKGEDVAQGKMTYPLAKALGRLPRREREALWSMVRGNREGGAATEAVSSIVEAKGVLDECRLFANRMVDDAWGALSPMLDESFAKAMIRAICTVTVRRG